MDKILIIDDDELVLRTLKALLEKKGYEVHTASTGEEGIEKAADEAYQLIISDVRMPGLGGIKAAQKIKQISENSGKKANFLFITGYADEDAPEHAVHLGVTDFMLKPFDVTQFLETVEKNLRSIEPIEHISSSPQLPYDPHGRWQFPKKMFVYEKLITLRATNMEGNVYFANYFLWQGEVREALLLSHPNFSEEFKKNQHVKMITHSAYQRFIQESYMGDQVSIEMTSREIKKCSFVLVFKFFNKRNKTFLGEGWQRIAFADLRSGKICATPYYLLDLVTPILQEETKDIALNA